MASIQNEREKLVETFCEVPDDPFVFVVQFKAVHFAASSVLRSQVVSRVKLSQNVKASDGVLVNWVGHHQIKNNAGFQLCHFVHVENGHCVSVVRAIMRVDVALFPILRKRKTDFRCEL